MTTPKENCFKDALDAYNDAFPDKNSNVELFKDWYRDADGRWYPANTARKFWHWLQSIWKTEDIQNGTCDPRAPGEPNPLQWRTPDITGPDEKCYDLKFTNADGKTDPWGSKPGMNNGGTQREDQETINKQTDPESGAMSLDKDSCRCKERGEPEPVTKFELSPFAVPVMPGVTNPSLQPLTGGAPAPAAPAAPEVPGGFGVPEFGLPAL